MGLFKRSAGRMTGRTTLLLAADPGRALLDAARLYDPNVSTWPGRLVFRNGVLLFGPVAVTSELEQQAGLPPGMAVAYYTGAAQQTTRNRRPHEAKHRDGDGLVQGLAARLGGTIKYDEPPLDRALLPSVYGEQAVPVDQVIELLSPYGGNLRVEDQTGESYSLSGPDISFMVAYWPPRWYREKDAPPALGALRSRPLHQWDLQAAYRRNDLARELVDRVEQAALALAARCGGVALDEYGFPITGPDDLPHR